MTWCRASVRLRSTEVQFREHLSLSSLLLGQKQLPYVFFFSHPGTVVCSDSIINGRLSIFLRPVCKVPNIQIFVRPVQQFPFSIYLLCNFADDCFQI